MDPAQFRQIELALIQLNDELKGDVISLGEYRYKRAKVLEGTEVTEQMLEQAPVYGDPKTAAEPDLTWGKLDERRRRRDRGIAEQPELPSIVEAYKDELRRLAAKHGLPEPHWPQDAFKPKTGLKKPVMPSQSVEGIRQALSNSLTPDPKLPEDIRRWMGEEGRPTT